MSIWEKGSSLQRLTPNHVIVVCFVCACMWHVCNKQLAPEKMNTSETQQGNNRLPITVYLYVISFLCFFGTCIFFMSHLFRGDHLVFGWTDGATKSGGFSTSITPPHRTCAFWTLAMDRWEEIFPWKKHQVEYSVTWEILLQTNHGNLVVWDLILFILQTHGVRT